MTRKTKARKHRIHNSTGIKDIFYRLLYEFCHNPKFCWLFCIEIISQPIKFHALFHSRLRYDTFEIQII